MERVQKIWRRFPTRILGNHAVLELGQQAQSGRVGGGEEGARGSRRRFQNCCTCTSTGGPGASGGRRLQGLVQGKRWRNAGQRPICALSGWHQICLEASAHNTCPCFDLPGTLLSGPNQMSLLRKLSGDHPVKAYHPPLQPPSTLHHNASFLSSSALNKACHYCTFRFTCSFVSSPFPPHPGTYTP